MVQSQRIAAASMYTGSICRNNGEPFWLYKEILLNMSVFRRLLLFYSNSIFYLKLLQSRLYSYKAKQKGNLRAHVERKHSIRKCLGCGQKFANYIGFRRHQLRECRKKACLTCRYCSYTSQYITQLKDHIRIEHKSRYNCKDCGKKYKNFESLKKHISVCNFNQEFQCDHCSYRNHSKGNLVRHIQSNHYALLQQARDRKTMNFNKFFIYFILILRARDSA